MKSLLAIPAASGMVYNDVLSLSSVIGCGLMCLSALLNTMRVSPVVRRIGELGEWGSAPLIFGTLFQVSFLLIGMAPETEKIGFIIPMTPGMVNGLFVMSFLLLAGRWWLGRSSAMIRPY